MSKILITGGAGFIGSALVHYWSSQGAEVHVIDLPKKIASRRWSINGVQFHPSDVTNPETFKRVGVGFDIVYHLAAQTSARVSEEQPYLDIDTNVKGVFNLCQWARETRPGRVVFSSSMAVYGSHGDNLTEDAALEPCSVYGITKLAGEKLLSVLRGDGIKVDIFRLFNVYGPGQDYSNLMQGMASVYIAMAITQDQIEVTGSFDRYRDFVYIDDVVSALVLPIPNTQQWIFNVGNGKPVTVTELLEVVLQHGRAINPKLTAIEVASHRGDVFGNFANNSALRGEGWNPSVYLHEGIEKAFNDALRVLRSSSNPVLN